ncbi:GNAT family N-acetyltransferase [Metabacillus fastidiosus]|uniref:GNAT family N-acetyltransferase n=1 Tax=Metabacillus fastidiosus TaxID=1458 RepID=UPI00082696A5|nr:GNAT family N-acetyltransferase [Metabacillus fastidiosus]MED4453052.1 GNAT family N-acetyltransferase [Metabacillus fastidiosus]MED4463018.1 GNAT family N-acetyltransferase [Metabacillus fastidiosus]
MCDSYEMIIRPAEDKDINRIIEAIASLITELSGGSDAVLPDTAKDVCNRLIKNQSRGVIFIAETVSPEAFFLGCITASIQEAIYIGGSYTLIQELYVHPMFRNQKIGSQLIYAVEQYCKEKGMNTLEVYLPLHSFIDYEKTLNFYEKEGFSVFGPRMKKKINF